MADTSESLEGPERSAAVAAERQQELHPKTAVQKLLAWLKDLKEVILILLFFASGAAWTVNYFATRSELNNYRCINDLTLKMLVNSQSEEFLTQQVRQARRELRRAEDAVLATPKDSPNYRNMVDALDDQKAALEGFIKSKEAAEKNKQAAFSDLQATTQGIRKACAGADRPNS